jgi:hypothetical protein
MAVDSVQPDPSSKAGRRLHLTISNVAGSVEHYHHFLLGFLVPLILHRRITWQNPAYEQVLIRSCGPMDEHIRQLGAKRIAIMDKTEHRALGESRPRFGNFLPARAKPLRYLELSGHDYPVRYSHGTFARARSALCEMFDDDIRAFEQSLAAGSDAGSPRILMVQRDNPHPFYRSKQAETKEAGAARRSIPNHAEIFGELARRFGNARNVTLENLTLPHQIALFSSADVIIAQHGAALSNLIWTRPGATVVEIVPRTLSQEILNVGFFSNLSRCMCLNYLCLWQEHEHAEMNPRVVREAIERSLPGFDLARAQDDRSGIALH